MIPIAINMVQSMAFFSPCGKLTKNSTRFGHSFLAPGAHLQQHFLRIDKWRPLTDLKVGDRLPDPADLIGIGQWGFRAETEAVGCAVEAG